MSHFLEQPGLFDQPIRLGPGERREPFRVMEEFFTDYRLHEWRHHLWNMIETCLATDNDAFAEPDERASLLQQYKDLEELLEAVWLLVERRSGESFQRADREGGSGGSGSGMSEGPAATPVRRGGGTSSKKAGKGMEGKGTEGKRTEGKGTAGKGMEGKGSEGKRTMLKIVRS